MKEIRQLTVTQIHIFPPDEIAFNSLRRPNAIEDIKNAYNLDLAHPFPGGFQPEGQLPIFVNGEFQCDHDKYLINKFQIEPRRIIITFSGPTSKANQYYAHVKNLLIELDLRKEKPKYKPIIVSEETVCIAKLEFTIQDLFSTTQFDKIQNALEQKIQSFGSNLSIFPSSVKYKIQYQDLPSELKKHKISLSEKEFVLEVRELTSINEQVFYTSSPTDSDTHLSLIDTLEKSVKAKR